MPAQLVLRWIVLAALYVVASPEEPSRPLGEWLLGVGCTDAEEPLRARGLETVESMLSADLSAAALKDLGLPMKQRKKLLRALVAEAQRCSPRTVLYESPRLELWDGFLSPEEAADVAALQFTRGEKNDTDGTRVVTYFDALDVLEAPLLSTIEQRVADWTGVPASDHTGMQAKLQTHHTESSHDKDHHGVHLDNNNNPFRAATTIVYLTDVPDEGRGGTVFPCLLPPLPTGATDAAAAAHREEATRREHLCRRATEAVHEKQGWGLSQSKEEDPEGLWKMASEVCAGTLAGLTIQPRAGRAVMFETGRFTFHDNGKSRPEMVSPLLWHAACELLKGTKRTLIKFQEVQPSDRAQSMQMLGSDAAMRYNRAGEKFQPSDRDHDGFLDERELRHLLALTPGGRKLEHVLPACDTDGDGRVSIFEFTANRMWFWARMP